MSATPEPELTIFVLTRNRPRMLRNTIEQYSSWPFPVRIVVHDSSDETAARENEAVALAHAPATAYVGYAPATRPDAKLRAAASSAGTPYALYAAEDDVLIPAGVADAIAFLNANRDFVACHGQYYSVRLVGPGEANLAVAQTNLSQDRETPFARLTSLMSRYRSIFYSVQRREALRFASDIPERVARGTFLELFAACKLLVAGKVAALPSAYLVRDFVTDRGDIEPFYRQHPTGLLLRGVPFLTEFYPGFRDEVATLLEAAQGSGAWREKVDVLYAMHFSRSFLADRVIAHYQSEGCLSQDDVRFLARTMAVPDTGAIPSQELVEVLRPYFGSGWPSYG